jgi:hypothetical protein
VVSTTPVSTTVGATLPTSYTFLDTPNANLCVDAFARQGIVLPENAVARTVNSFNVSNNGIAWQDQQTSDIPVLNVVSLSSNLSDVTFQFLNPIGFYCIVKNEAETSNVSIQRKCSAKLAQLEPMATATVKTNTTQVSECSWSRHFGYDCEEQFDFDGYNTVSKNSSIIELPCIN